MIDRGRSERPASSRSPGQVLTALQHLCALTEEQIAAARSLRSRDLAALNERRTDALFSLRLALEDNGLPDSEDPDVQSAVRRLARAEQRLASIASTVLDRIARLDLASPAPVYDRTGRVG